jgi:glycerol dehydrogenase-like iron-containing ADH family enzyme
MVCTLYADGMTQRKRRLTVTVDAELVEAANRAVASGSADSMSAWVSAALTDRARRDQQLARLGDSIADYEAEFGEITDEEIARQRRADRQHAIVVRGTHKRAAKARTA